MKKQSVAKLAGGLCIGLLILWLTWNAVVLANSHTPDNSQPKQSINNDASIDVAQSLANSGYTIHFPATLNNYSFVPLNDWSTSGHADETSESFTHWDGANPPEIPISCAKCHSTPGFWDFLGEDGSPAGSVDKPAPIGTVIECKACHNVSAESLTDVSFNSGTTVTSLDRESVCMQCHQARNSTVSVDEMVDGFGPDEQSGTFSFLSPHYLTAADTFFGGEAQGAYQYQTNTYRSRYLHVEEMNTCISCHQEHSLDVAPASCTVCHTEVTTTADFVNIRSSTGDFDGDGDETEGIAGEIASIHEALFQSIKDYAKDIIGSPIVYSGGSYPYFFNDTNGNGEPDPDEISFNNRYTEWTPRLLEATYNYNYVAKEPGAYSHNPLYILQILYDTLKNIGGNVSGMLRPS